jgi:hypothetical protein
MFVLPAGAHDAVTFNPATISGRNVTPKELPEGSADNE